MRSGKAQCNLKKKRPKKLPTGGVGNSLNRAQSVPHLGRVVNLFLLAKLANSESESTLLGTLRTETKPIACGAGLAVSRPRKIAIWRQGQ